MQATILEDSIFVKTNHDLVFDDSSSQNHSDHKNKWLRVRLENIYYLEAYGNYVKILVSSKMEKQHLTTLIISGNLKTAQTTLDTFGYHFLRRCNRFQIVNVNKIESIEKDLKSLKLASVLMPFVVGSKYKIEFWDCIKFLELRS